MAVNYADLFEDLGEFVEAVNLFRGYAAAGGTVETMLNEISAELAGNGRYDVLGNVPQTFESYRDQLTGWAGEMARKGEERLTHLDTVKEQLPLAAYASTSDVLAELFADMVLNAVDVNRSAVTIGAVSAAAANVGNPTVLTTKVLDGVTAPISGGISIPGYAGLDSELAVTAETMTLTCSRDNPSDGVTEGTEQFSLKGGAAGRDAFDWRSEGSGDGPGLTMLNGSGAVTDGAFENWTSTNTPTNWTIDSGTAGTHIFQETSGASIKRGVAALRLTGATAQATIQVSQNQTGGLTRLVPLKRYCVAVWVLGNASVAGGTLTIQFEGTGYSPGAGEKIEMNAAALAAATTYGLQSFFVTMPASISSDMKLVIKTTGTLTNAQSIRIDGLTFGEVTWHGGIGIAVVAGNTKPLRGDRWTFAVSNDNAGVFQTFFRRWLKVQMPSDVAPSIADSLAT